MRLNTNLNATESVDRDVNMKPTSKSVFPGSFHIMTNVGMIPVDLYLHRYADLVSLIRKDVQEGAGRIAAASKFGVPGVFV